MIPVWLDLARENRRIEWQAKPGRAVEPVRQLPARGALGGARIHVRDPDDAGLLEMPHEALAPLGAGERGGRLKPGEIMPQHRPIPDRHEKVTSEDHPPIEHAGEDRAGSGGGGWIGKFPTALTLAVIAPFSRMREKGWG